MTVMARTAERAPAPLPDAIVTRSTYVPAARPAGSGRLAVVDAAVSEPALTVASAGASHADASVTAATLLASAPSALKTTDRALPATALASTSGDEIVTASASAGGGARAGQGKRRETHEGHKRDARRE